VIAAPVLASQFHQRRGTTVITTGGNVVSNGFASVGLTNGDNATLTVSGAGRFTESGFGRRPEQPPKRSNQWRIDQRGLQQWQ